MSTDLQLKGDSRRRQFEASQVYAQEHGLELVDETQLEDIGISAFRGANIREGALGKFLEAVKSKTVPAGSYLIVESLDRISREEVLTAQSVFLSIIQAGINLVTLADGRIYSAGKTELADLIVSLVIMSRAHEESRTKSLRVAAAWSNKRSRASTTPLTAICPAWLRLADDRQRYQIIEPRAEIIRSVFKDSASGIGIYSIADRLNRSRTPTFNESNGWHPSYVAKILSNRAAIGEFQPHHRVDGVRKPAGEPLTGYFPAVVDERLFYQAQQGRAERKVNGRGRKGAHVTNIFSGVAKCAYCRSAMKFENKGGGPKGGQYIICERAIRRLGCPGVRWRYRDFEASVLAFVRELNVESMLSDASDMAKQTLLSSEINELNGRVAHIERLMEQDYALREDGVAVDFISRKLSENDGRRSELLSQIQLRESERQVLNSRAAMFHESKIEIRSLLDRIQDSSGDDVYKLRSRIAASLKSLIETFFVASVGSVPSIEKAILFLLSEPSDSGAADVIDNLKRALADPERRQRYFIIGFKDGSIRAVTPDSTDPLVYKQQLSGSVQNGLLMQTAEQELTMLSPPEFPDGWWMESDD